jgi:hypothetical protein
MLVAQEVQTFIVDERSSNVISINAPLKAARAGIAASVLLFCAPPAHAQNTCHAADQYSARFIQGINAMMDSSSSVLRTNLQMPLVASSAIVLISDSTVCARAGFASDSIVRVIVPGASHPPTTASLYVIGVGSSFAVADLNSPADHHPDIVFFFGPLWEYRGAFSM